MSLKQYFDKLFLLFFQNILITLVAYIWLFQQYIVTLDENNMNWKTFKIES